MYLNILLIVIIGIGMSGCYSPETSKNTSNAHTDLRAKYLSLKMIQSASSNHDGIVISDFTADTLSIQSTNGISTAFNIAVKEQCLKDIRNEGYDGQLVDLTCNGASGKIFCYRNSCLPDLNSCHIS